MRGIEFQVNKNINTYLFLFNLLQYIKSDHCVWNIEQSEIYPIENGQVLMHSLSNGIYTWEQIENYLKECYAIFCTIGCFESSEEIKELNNYNDFLASNCKCFIIITDCDYYEVYIKDQHTLNDIYGFCALEKVSDLTYLTDANDARTSFVI